MESNLKTVSKDSDDVRQRSYQSQSLPQKDPSPILKIEAEMKGGEDFPDLLNHSSVFIKNNIVLFGGRDSNEEINNVFHIYNLKARTWSQKELKGEANEIPKPRLFHTANVVRNFIFIIGGKVEGQKDENVYKIDFSTKKCQIIGKIIDPIKGHTADVHKQSIYMFGGYSYETREFSSRLQKFNLRTNECEVIKPNGYSPKGRFGHSSIILQDTLYVFGGHYLKSNFIFLQDLFSIDLFNNQFSKLDQRGLIPSPRTYFSFFAFEDKLYLFGGHSDPKYCQDFYAFDLKSSTWITQEAENGQCLLKRAAQSTLAVNVSSRKLKVYIVGGKESKISWQKNMNVITLTNNRIYWILHYLKITNIHNLPGLDLDQEIIEMFE